MGGRVTRGACKDCGKEFFQTATARQMDVARGLSEPERCPDCRQINAQAIRGRGAAYWTAPLETDDAKRCWGKYGLAKLVRAHPVRHEIPDNSADVRLPLWYRDNRADFELAVAAGRVSKQDQWVAQKFAAIAPAAEALVKNLEDPRGKRVSVLVGPTGTGKSTWVPYRILRSKIGEQGRICVTQPRRITLRKADDGQDDATTPGFIAKHLLRLPGGVGAGQEIGYQISGEYDQQDRYTKLLFVTDGTLIRWLETGRVGQFDVVVVDEAHEQSANMELIFALLRYRLPLFPRLRVVIASATVDVDKFRRYFGNGDPDAVFFAEGDPATPHTIHDRWLESWSGSVPEAAALVGCSDPRARASLLPDAVAATVKALCRRPGFSKLAGQGSAIERGDILVFVPTIPSVESVRDAVRAVSEREKLGLNVLVSHAQMTPAELSAIKRSEAAAERAAEANAPTNPRRVIIATNYAETSVTFMNLSFVVDSGLILDPAWDPRTCSTRFDPQWHSQAGCKQRKGRVGRVRPGECYRLYTEAEHGTFPVQTPAAVTRMPLDSFFLSAKAAGIEDLDSFQWLGRSIQDAGQKELHESEVRRSQTALGRRKAIDPTGDITSRGLELGGIQVPRVELAECLAEADTFACALEVATFLAFTSQSRSPFARGEAGMLGYARWRSGCHDDLEFYLRLYHHWAVTTVQLASNGPHRSQDRKRARNEWAQAEGLNPDYFESVTKTRTDNLRQFTRRTHTDIQERELDLQRLHRVRLVLARCLPEWVYTRHEGGGFKYQPSQECPVPNLLEIDRDSACCADPDLAAFVCIERQRTRGDRLLARHVVKITPEWLPHLKTAGPIGRAILLTDTIRAEANVAARSGSSVVQRPDLDVSRYKARQEVQRLRVVRFQNADGDAPGVLLAEDLDSGMPVLVTKATRDPVQVGEILRARVTRVDVAAGRVTADQQHLLDNLRKEATSPTTVLGCTVTSVRQDAAGSRAIGAFLRIMPGISGWMDRRDLSYRDQQTFDQTKVGDRWDCCIKGTRNDSDIILIPSEVAAGRRQRLGVDQRFETAIVADFLDSNAEREGLFIEILPGRQGLLHRRALSGIDVVSKRKISQYRRGQAIDVLVKSLSQKDGKEQISLRPYAPTEDQLRVGDILTGYVQGFLDSNTGSGRQAAFVEIIPNINGFLHFRQAGGRLSTLTIGTEVRVRIAQINPDPKRPGTRKIGLQLI